MNRFLLAVLLVVAGTLAGYSKSDGATTAQSLADRAAQMLSRGEVRGVAGLMHYPPKYTPEERKKDMSATGDGLDLAAREFGAISTLKPLTGVAVFYEVGGTGGGVPYISSLSPHASAQFLYEAKFAKRGTGFVHITTIQLTAESPFEILGVYLGLPAANPKSKPAILEVTRKQLIQMGVPLTPDITRQLKAALQPVRFPM